MDQVFGERSFQVNSLKYNFKSLIHMLTFKDFLGFMNTIYQIAEQVDMSDFRN